MLENKARFVEMVCKGNLVVSNRKRLELLAELKHLEFNLFPKDQKDEDDSGDEENSGADENNSIQESTSDAELAKSYEYLLGMKIWTLTYEKVEELRRQRDEKAEEVEKLKETTPEAIWLADLDAIEELLDERDTDLGIEVKTHKKALTKKVKRVRKKTEENEDKVSTISKFFICPYSIS